MHELPVTEHILNIVLKHAERNRVQRVVSITLTIGDLSELENEWIQHYFDYLSKDTIAAGAKLHIERMPIVIRCNACGQTESIRKDQLGQITCSKCGKSDDFSLVSGREYYIKEMEAQ
ncbi:MAG: hydrogenase maturation nickel metallochaperone HypA [Desulfobacterales bacterium]|nr:hydrogenase maturation nickel metallochaperone HypA [Desulfobacterales bacterium]